MNPYPKLAAHLRVAQAPEEPAAVAKAIAGWNGETLEEAGAASGVVMPMVRSAGVSQDVCGIGRSCGNSRW